MTSLFLRHSIACHSSESWNPSSSPPEAGTTRPVRAGWPTIHGGFSSNHVEQLKTHLSHRFPTPALSGSGQGGMFSGGLYFATPNGKPILLISYIKNSGGQVVFRFCGARRDVCHPRNLLSTKKAELFASSAFVQLISSYLAVTISPLVGPTRARSSPCSFSGTLK